MVAGKPRIFQKQRDRACATKPGQTGQKNIAATQVDGLQTESYRQAILVSHFVCYERQIWKNFLELDFKNDAVIVFNGIENDLAENVELVQLVEVPLSVTLEIGLTYLGVQLPGNDIEICKTGTLDADFSENLSKRYGSTLLR